MNRVWDYIGFADWFSRLGYIVLWLHGSPYHLTRPTALRAVGVASAMLVPVRLLLCAVSRWRAAAGAALAVPMRKPAALLRPRRRKPAGPLRPAKPRSLLVPAGMPE